MDLPILYSFRRCPYAMRARLALMVSGQSVVLREVVLRDKPAAMLDISPKGTVPVLQLADGTVIDESYEILLWALEQNDPGNWLAADRQELDALVRRNDFDFKLNLDGYKYPERHPEKARDEYRESANRYLSDLDIRLRDAAYLAGTKPGAADIAVMPFIRQFANTDRDWFESAPYPDLRKWLAGWLKNELFLGVMDKYPQWVPDQSPVVFPGETDK